MWDLSINIKRFDCVYNVLPLSTHKKNIHSKLLITTNLLLTEKVVSLTVHCLLKYNVKHIHCFYVQGKRGKQGLKGPTGLQGEKVHILVSVRAITNAVHHSIFRNLPPLKL